MNQETLFLKGKAELARDKYRFGSITRDEAKKEIMPYINAINEKSLELAKKYNMKAKKINFNSFIR